MSRLARWGVPALVALFIWTLTTHGKFSVSGDEPHYLIVAESLLADRDLDLENNYAANDSLKFGPDGLQPGPHVTRTSSGALWSVHDIGLPVALLPVYALATRLAQHAPEDVLARYRQTRGLFAYSLISVSLILLTAGGAALLLSGLRRVTSVGRASAVVMGLVLSPPVLSQSFLVFPEALALFAVFATVWLLCLQDHELTTTRVTLVIAALGALPWVGHKYSFFVFGLVFLIVRRRRHWFNSQHAVVLTTIALLFILPQIALHAWTLHAWGTFGGPQLDKQPMFSLGGMETGGLGLLFDRERGLLGYAPIYVIVPMCWALTWRRQWDLAVPVLLLFAPMAAFSEWRAGFSPAARHIVALTPLLAVPVAIALARPIVRRVAIGVSVFQAAITAVIWQRPRALWPKDLGTNQALERLPGIGPVYEHWLPSMAAPGASWRGWICLAIIAAASAAVVLVARGRTTVTASRR